DVEHIVVQLKVLLEVAAAKGRAVAIGHPYPQTLAALSQLPRMAAGAGVEIVSLSTMLPAAGRGAGPPQIPQ
ncbi:MAG: divergent polysaccharide deacetylase family protein, partial [Deltaproteobacteria bacterium]|nr:divergent polysaccharide deacetylase family protein [Deltaproteobacteria bacterium]